MPDKNLYDRIKVAVAETRSTISPRSSEFLAGYEAAKRDVIIPIGLAIIEDNVEYWRSIVARSPRHAR